MSSKAFGNVAKLRDILNVMDPAFGAKGDGSTDDTVAFTQALTAAVGKTLFVPKPSSKYMLDPIDIPSNTHLIIQPGSVLEAQLGYDQSSGTAAERLITINGRSNVTIEAYGATFQYNSGYTFTSEFNHCFRIIGTCSEVWIYGAAANDSGGDGFFIGPSDPDDEVNTSPDGVYLVDCSADGNRRNGFSVVSGRVRLVRPHASNHPATILGYGIDIEPNKPATFLDVVVEDPVTSGNAGSGIATVLINPDSTTATVHVEIRNHQSDGDNWHFSHHGSTASSSPRGHIKYLNGTGKNAGAAGIRVLNNPVDGPMVELDRPVVLDCNQDTGGTVQSASGIVVIANNSMTSTQKLGNVIINQPYIHSSDGDMQAPIWIEDTRSSPQGTDRVFVLDPVRLEGGQVAFCGFGGNGVWRDELPALSHDLGSSDLTLTTLRRYYGLIHNASSSAERQVLLPNRADYPTMTFEVRAAQFLRVDPDSASEIQPGSTGAGKYIRSNTVGSRLKIKRLNSTTWFIVEQVGTWAFEP